MTRRMLPESIWLDMAEVFVALGFVNGGVA
jgi:hypothetical protein